jgi:hypothetical protein
MAAGGNAHFTTYMWYFPEQDLVALAHSNGGDDGALVLTRLVLAAYGESLPVQASAGSPGERALVDAFTQAVLDPNPAARRAFMAANAGPVFLQREGIETIVARFDALHDALSSMKLERFDVSPMGEARLSFTGTAANARVLVQFGGTPEQPKVWTVVEFSSEADPGQLAGHFAETLTGRGWYVSFDTDHETFVIFPGKVFRYPKGDDQARAEAETYALSVGVPKSQTDW